MDSVCRVRVFIRLGSLHIHIPAVASLSRPATTEEKSRDGPFRNNGIGSTIDTYNYVKHVYSFKY